MFLDPLPLTLKALRRDVCPSTLHFQGLVFCLVFVLGRLVLFLSCLAFCLVLSCLIFVLSCLAFFLVLSCLVFVFSCLAFCLVLSRLFSSLVSLVLCLSYVACLCLKPFVSSFLRHSFFCSVDPTTLTLNP